VKRKVVMLGLDGGTWRHLDKFVEEGLMPNLKSMMKNGAKGILQSGIPYTSRTSWLSISTGTNPGKHGIPHHIVGGKPEVPLIWEILSEAKIKQIIVNELVTYPPLHIDGIMISGGFSTPSSSSDYVYPRKIFEEINDLVDGYIPSLSPEAFKKIQQGSFDYFYQKLKEWGEKVVETSLYLSKKFEWQLLATIIENSDFINHFYWDKPVFLKSFYQWLDETIGQFYKMSLSNNANLLIVSDHGGGPIKKHFLVNTWFQNSGFTKFRKPTEVRKFLSKTKLKRKFIRRGLDKFHLRKVTSRLTPSELKKMIPIDENEAGFIEDSSKVYSEAYNEITVNVKNKNEYEKLRNEIIQKLLQLKDDDGNNIVKEAFKREESFHGPYITRAYDIQFLLNDGYCYSSSLKEKYLLTPEELGNIRTGDHRPEGIFFAVGPDIKKDYTISQTNLWDICPTILHILGVQIPSYIDGKVKTEIFDQQSPLYSKKILFKKESEKEFIKKRILEKGKKLKL